MCSSRHAPVAPSPMGIHVHSSGFPSHNAPTYAFVRVLPHAAFSVLAFALELCPLMDQHGFHIEELLYSEHLLYYWMLNKVITVLA